MIPPAPSDLLTLNPQFANLHTTLTTKLLDPDGSTRATNTTYTPTAAKLHDRRIALTKERILLSTLTAITTNEHLPEPLRDLVALIAAYIPQAATNNTLRQDAHALLAPSVAAFQRQLPLISRTLAAQLIDTERTLASAAAVAALHSSSPSPFSSSATQSDALGPLMTAQTTYLTHLRAQLLPAALTAATDALTALLRAQTSQIRAAIGGLEQRKHGAEARHVLARAAFLGGVASALRGKVRVEGLEVRRDAGGDTGGIVGRRVEGRLAVLGEEMAGLESRREVLEGALGEFEEAGQQGGGGEIMRRLGRRYREVEEEIAEVKSDVERLRREREGGRGSCSEDSSWIH